MSKKTAKKSKEVSVDDLALMVQKGFLNVEGKLSKIEGKIDRLERSQAVLEKGQEDIKMQLNRRVHIFNHKDLEFRVEKLEEKVGIGKRK